MSVKHITIIGCSGIGKDRIIKTLTEQFNLDEIAPFDKYPHANIFLKIHVGTVINLDTIDENADLIKKLSLGELSTITLKQLYEKGISMGNPNYIV